jgi:hypothetical protein
VLPFRASTAERKWSPTGSGAIFAATARTRGPFKVMASSPNHSSIAAPEPEAVLHTPDGRYIIVRERLWRASNPALLPGERERLVASLMQARRNVHLTRKDLEAQRKARAAVNLAKIGLGERGPVWWDDGAPDYKRHLIHNTPYADWWKKLHASPATSISPKDRPS